MLKTFGLLSFAALFTLQSCSLNTTTTYYPDTATSSESNIMLEQNMMGMMSMMGDKNMGDASSKELNNLPTEWKSLYDIQKEEKGKINEDSAKILKKMYLKVTKENGEISGISIKNDKLFPAEIKSILAQDKKLKSLPLQDIADWDGKTLTINTEKFNSTAMFDEMAKDPEKDIETVPVSKSDSLEGFGKDMAQGMMGMLKMFDMNLTSTLKFQKPIKSIVGKHDFVKKIDDKTIQISVRSKELMAEGKNLKNKDKKIIVTTE